VSFVANAGRGRVGSGADTIPAGDDATVVLRLNQRGRAALARRGKLRVTVNGTVDGGSAFTATLKLKSRR
jgi:hypothetical protein